MIKIFSIAQDLRENPVVLNNGGTVVVKITIQADGKVALVTFMFHLDDFVISGKEDGNWSWVWLYCLHLRT